MGVDTRGEIAGSRSNSVTTALAEEKCSHPNIGLDFGYVGAGGLRAVELTCGLVAELNGCYVNMVEVLQSNSRQRGTQSMVGTCEKAHEDLSWDEPQASGPCNSTHPHVLYVLFNLCSKFLPEG